MNGTYYQQQHFRTNAIVKCEILPQSKRPHLLRVKQENKVLISVSCGFKFSGDVDEAKAFMAELCKDFCKGEIATDLDLLEEKKKRLADMV